MAIAAPSGGARIVAVPGVVRAAPFFADGNWVEFLAIA
jgi:hypothetical protein